MRQRSKGTWELRVYVGRDPMTSRPRQATRTFTGGERAASKELARFVTETTDKWKPDGKRTVKVLLARWLEDAERRLSPVTIANYRQFAKQYLEPALGDMRVDRLDTEDLDRLYLALERKGCGPHTVRHVHATIRAALSQAKRWKWVSVNVANDARPTPLPQKRLTTPTPAEVTALVDAIEPEDPHLAIIVLLAALTGCRRGELCALKWSDVDWERSILHVRRSFVDAGGKVIEKPPKSGRERDVVLDPFGSAALEVLRTLQADKSAETGDPLPEDGWLLSNDGLGWFPRRPNNVGAQFRRFSRAAGIPIGLHTLRHYSATELVGAGVDVRTVADRLGHADPGFTLRVYTHSVNERDREAAAMLGNQLAPVSK